jgi:hypothetical protein
MCDENQRVITVYNSLPEHGNQWLTSHLYALLEFVIENSSRMFASTVITTAKTLAVIFLFVSYIHQSKRRNIFDRLQSSLPNARLLLLLATVVSAVVSRRRRCISTVDSFFFIKRARVHFVAVAFFSSINRAWVSFVVVALAVL